MTTLTEALNYVNQVYGQVNGLSVPQANENISVAGYLSIVDSLQVQALQLMDDAIAATQAAAQYINVSATLQSLYATRQQLVTLHQDVHSALGGVSSSLTMDQAWTELTAAPPPTVTPPSTEPPPTEPPPSVLPSGDGVVIYGDTPMLLRASDPSVPIGAAFTGPPQGVIATSPEISIETNGTWRIGTVTGSGAGDAVQIIKDSTIGAAKGLLGEVFSGSSYAGYSLQAWEAYDLGSTINDKASKSIDFISSGLDVIQGNMSLSEWNAQHDAFLGQTKNDFDALAASAAVSKIPLVGWVLSPVVDAYMKLSYKLQNTNSFEISVTAASTVTGGTKGGVFLGGTQNDYIVVGSGNALASGGDGNDTFVTGAGAQYLLGDSGIDTAVFSDAHSQHTLTLSGSGHTVSGPQGTQTLVGVERLTFSDKSIALDLGTGEAAGNTARLIGAAFDSGYITPQFVGAGISLFDAGYSMLQVAQIVLETSLYLSLAGSSSNTTFVNTIYQNVAGTLPSAADRDYFVGLLQGSGGSMSQAELLVLAANAESNATNINLVGLQQTGVEFI